MPFDQSRLAPRRIAVIGAGISGMGAAHLLADRNRVTLFEAEPRLGGHARTRIAGKRGDQPVDTGFIVFNRPNYPHLTALFARLEVPFTDSTMSFAASIDGGRIEYALHDADRVFAQRRNILRPAFLRMVRDVWHFNRSAVEMSRDPGMTIGGLLAALGTGPWFRDYYLKPFSGAIWSTPVERILDFPATAMVEFFRNHALLNHSGQHQWYTVQGGSIEYVRRLEAAMRAQGVDLRLGAPVEAVRRLPEGGAEVRARGNEWEAFDEVIFASHSDQALAMLADPSPEETRLLGAVGYQANDVVLHADTSVMPKRRKVWASWNYAEEAGKSTDRIDVTYWMNSLQPIPMDDLMFVTLNSTRPIRQELIYDQVTLHHPVYDLAALDAQKRVAEMNGTRSTWFCGAWMRNGFHEDGLASAVAVVEALEQRPALPVAAE
jgi:predicted NAD/FAD-binding protein